MAEKTIWPVGSNIGVCDTTAEKFPRHLKFSVLCTINKVQCLENLKVLCPWHHKSSLHSFQFLCHHCTSVFRVLTSGTGTTGFLSHSGLTSLGKDWSWASSSLPMSPDVSWAEAFECYVLSSVHLWWYGTWPHCHWSACDGAVHCWGWPVGHLAKVVCSLLFFCKKKLLFVRICSQLLAGWPIAYWCCCVSATNHRHHTLGTNFCCCRLMPPLADWGGFSCTGPTGGGQRQRQFRL